jgi:hypothetical protein
MKRAHQIRRTVGAIVVFVIVAFTLYSNADLWQLSPPKGSQPTQVASGQAASVLDTLAVKGRAPKTGYERSQFGDGWKQSGGCDTRNSILHRDLTATIVNDKCQVTKGMLSDPYTGKIIAFTRGASSSADVQIDHVVALSDAWQKGAQQLSAERREDLANDPLELLAVDGPANQQKSDGDAATWLPSNKAFRCQYVARQVAVKKKYQLWVTQAEKDAIVRVLSVCPGQLLPSS